VAGCCKHGNEILGPTRDKISLPMGHYQVSVPYNSWSKVRVLVCKHGGNYKVLKTSVVNKLTT